MKTIKIILIAVFIFTFQFGFSQKRLLEKGDKEYFGYNYAKAIKYYEAVDIKDIDIERILADCYRKTEVYDNAKSLYERILSKPERTFDDVWNYFSVLLILEEYQPAMNQLRLLSELKPNDSRVKRYLADTSYYNTLKHAEPAFEIRNLKMNNDQQDFSPVLYKDIVLFASTRNSEGFISRLWNGNSLPFLNILKAKIDYTEEFIDVKPFYKKFNKKYHDGPVSFNGDGTVMAITRNNYKSKSADGTRNLQIFISEYINDKWTDPISFPYNNPEYSVGHASLTPDGRFMYFASDMPGGKGGTDIYKIERRKDGTWGKLINIETINTEGDEMFPYYHPNGFLFFSSNGHPGLGGLDIFVTSAANDSYSSVKNLGIPVNSSRDDFAMAFDNDLKKGYFTSSRKDGKGNDDIYFAKALKPFKLKKMIMGVTKDKENNIIANAFVSLTLNKTVIDSVFSDSLGHYEFSAEYDTLYNLYGTKKGYTDDYNTVNTDVPKDTIYADLILDKIPKFSLYVLVINKKTDEPLDSVTVTISNNLTDKEDIIYTSKNGDYKTSLPDKKINDRISYNLKLEKSGFLTKTITSNQTLYKEGEYKIIDTLDPLVALKVGDDLAKLFSINPIYFDLNKFNIRGDASFELDKIVAIMNAYPTVVIELGSHTDCRASYAYNMKLSDNRAKASAAYIKERITNPDRIYGKGYGESKLVNGCACEGNIKSNCSEEEHQRNRRTEFIILRQ